MNWNLPPDELDRELVFEFFWRFSVFECALKATGFVRARGMSDAAEADWDLFAQEIDFRKCSTPGLPQAVTALRQLNPKRQVFRGGRLVWEEQAPTKNKGEQYTIELLKRVRNNLFHGGKYPDGPIGQVERDQKILRAALTILNGCYDAHAGVRNRIRMAA